MDWFRWYHDTVTDNKLALIAKQTGQGRPLVIAFWAFMLETASKAPDRGGIFGLDLDEAALALESQPHILTGILEEFKNRKLINDYFITNWHKRQPLSDAERAAKYRQKTKTSQTVTAASRDRHAREEQNRSEQSRADILAPVAQKKATRLLPDWKPSQELFDWARAQRPDLEITSVVDEFVDYWVAKPGTDGLKLDWDRTFKNWVRRARGSFRPTGTQVAANRIVPAHERTGGSGQL